MENRKKLSDEFSKRVPTPAMTPEPEIEKYSGIAKGYSEIENVMAVLSILNHNESIVTHGLFSDFLDIDLNKCTGKIDSIWEDEIFSAIHPDDLKMKFMQELLFFHYINRLPKQRRFTQCLMQRLRMRSKNGEWIDTLHRLYYIPAYDGKTIRFALCLYGPMTSNLTGGPVVINTVTGQSENLDSSSGRKILSRQESEVLKLIDNGNRSRDIADILKISINTVSRHRQNIIAKLKVRNSAEACRIARNLSLI